MIYQNITSFHYYFPSFLRSNDSVIYVYLHLHIVMLESWRHHHHPYPPCYCTYLFNYRTVKRGIWVRGNPSKQSPSYNLVVLFLITIIPMFARMLHMIERHGSANQSHIGVCLSNVHYNKGANIHCIHFVFLKEDCMLTSYYLSFRRHRFTSIA